MHSRIGVCIRKPLRHARQQRNGFLSVTLYDKARLVETDYRSGYRYSGGNLSRRCMIEGGFSAQRKGP